MELFLEWDMLGRPEEKPKISQPIAAVTQNDRLNPSAASITSARARRGKNMIAPCSSEEHSAWDKSMNMMTNAAEASSSSADQLSTREKKLTAALEKVFGAEHLDEIRKYGFFDLAPRLTNLAAQIVLKDLSTGIRYEIRKTGALIRDACHQGEPILPIHRFPELPDTFKVTNILDVEAYGHQLSQWLEETDRAWIAEFSAEESRLEREDSPSLLLAKLRQVQRHFDNLEEVLTYVPEDFLTVFRNHKRMLEGLESLPDEPPSPSGEDIPLLKKCWI
ncbi:hypothetical protein PTTG_28597 [Puccinia triticina 1-1 BBBD Race 1]|uniref:Uncharacterized protein n=2 Tax=Puccinia triticina TaxID=208348 RepID=A0A180GAG2_PUCT1|nr:hypothetical protein PTTG_28597 [Puccinia triticina 1-1 BBBD Race 1]